MNVHKTNKNKLIPIPNHERSESAPSAPRHHLPRYKYPTPHLETQQRTHIYESLPVQPISGEWAASLPRMPPWLPRSQLFPCSNNHKLFAVNNPNCFHPEYGHFSLLRTYFVNKSPPYQQFCSPLNLSPLISNIKHSTPASRSGPNTGSTYPTLSPIHEMKSNTDHLKTKQSQCECEPLVGFMFGFLVVEWEEI